MNERPVTKVFPQAVIVASFTSSISNFSAKLQIIMNYALGFAAFFQKRIINYELFCTFAAKI
jgi:hypothetical protein